MKNTVRYACGHTGALYAAAPLGDLEKKRCGGRICPLCVKAAATPKRKPRRVKDDDLAGDIFGNA